MAIHLNKRPTNQSIGDTEMEQKVILITGASSGMGKVTAINLIKEGHIVYGASFDPENMKDLEKLGGKILDMDVTKDEQIEAGVKEVIDNEGRIDVLWNNAGYGLYGPVEEIPLEQGRHQFDVNFFGLVKLTQVVTPHMRKQNSGLIINTSSMGGKVYFPLGAWYHATKHAVEGFSDCLRLELEPFGINVVVLEPGAIETGFYNALLKNVSDEWLKGPYGKRVERMKNFDTSSMKGSPPSVISETVQKIISTDKPKTRYVVGAMARPMMFMRKWFGDRFYDGMIKRNFG